MKVVVLGGGPVGLYTAARLAQQGIEVTVIEERAKATRRQVVVLDQKTLSRLPPSVVESILGPDGRACYVDSPVSDSKAICYRKPTDRQGPQRAAVELKVFEKALQSYAESVGAIVVRPSKGKLDVEVGKAITVDGKSYRYDVLIGADGPNSAVREYLGCGTRPVYPVPTTYALVAIFSGRGTFKRTKARSTKPERKTVQQNSRVFRDRPGDLLYVGLTLPDSVGKQIEQDNGRLPPSVKAVLDASCRAAGTECSDDVDTVVLQVSAQRSNCWFRRQGKQWYFLVGDAAMTTHFFSGSGLNRGFRMAERVAKVLQSPIETGIKDQQLQLYYDQLSYENAKAVGEIVEVLKSSDKICQQQSRAQLKAQVEQSVTDSDLDDMSNAELCFLLGDRRQYDVAETVSKNLPSRRRLEARARPSRWLPEFD